MYAWLSSFLSELDKEAVTVLGTGMAAVVVGVATGLRGVRNGTPSTTTVSQTAEALAKNSCGAPEMTLQVIEFLRRQDTDMAKLLEDMIKRQTELNFRLIEIGGDVQRMSDKVTRIEDRTGHR